VAQKLDTNVCANMKGTGMYKNGTEIMCSTEDGFVDATQACRLYDKNMYKYMKKVGTKKVLNEIAKDMDCDVESLMRKQDGHTLVHQRVMVNLDEHLSPAFAAEVTLWVTTILNHGSCTIDGVPADTVKYLNPPTEIPDIIDLTPYENKEVFYLASFTPVERVSTPVGLLSNNISPEFLYKYGMTHDIQKRMSQHRNDLSWKNFRCQNVIISKGKSPLKMEARIKVLIKNMDIQINIKSKIKYKTECFACTKEMYKKILSNIISYNMVKTNQNIDIPCIDLVKSNILNSEQYMKYMCYVMELKKIEATSDASIKLAKATSDASIKLAKATSDASIDLIKAKSDAEHRRAQDEIELTKVRMEFLCRAH